MQEPYKQGRAYQFGPESCAGLREESGEALTGGSSGEPLYSEIITLCVATRSVSVIKTASVLATPGATVNDC